MFRQLFEAAASFIGDRGAYDSTTDTYDGLSASPVIFIWDLDLEIDARYFSFQYNLDSLVDDESIFASINGNLLFLNFAQSFSPGIWNYSGLIDLISLCGPAGQSGDRISDGTGWCPASVAEYSVVFRSPGTGDDCDLRDCACWHRSDRTATPSYGSLTLRLKSQPHRFGHFAPANTFPTNQPAKHTPKKNTSRTNSAKRLQNASVFRKRTKRKPLIS